MTSLLSSIAQKKITLAKNNQKKIVFTNGCFDLIHTGHVRYLKKAKSYGDFLIIGLNDDKSVKKLKGKSRPILPLADRKEILASLSCVDLVIPFSDSTPYKLICAITPDVLVKGGDWKESDIVGASFVRQRGGAVISGIFVRGQSTTKIIKKIVKTHS